MITPLRRKQSGFAVIIVVIAVAVLSAGSLVGYVKVKESQNAKAAEEKQKVSNQIALEAKAKADLKKAEKKTEPTPTPTSTQIPTPTPETPKPTPTPTKAPTPKPTATTPNITPFTYSDNIGCDTTVTAYASKTGGTPLYNNTADAYAKTNPVQTLAYGTALQIRCKDGDFAQSAYNGSEKVVTISELSKTKP